MGTRISEIDYINETVWCRLGQSKIHGVGVLAIRDIPKGTKLTDNSRTILNMPSVFYFTEEEFAKLLPEIQDLILDKTIYSEGDKILPFISPNYECYLQDFCNHSSEPNVSKYFIALRDIKKGEEILEDFTSFTKLHLLNKKHYNFI